MDATHLETLQKLEVTIKKCEGIALEARWESGHYLNSLKNGKQLPRGLRAECAKALEVSESELTARMKFATKYPSAEELNDAISKFGSWFRIVREGLTDNPRPKVAKQPPAKLPRLVAALRELDTAELEDPAARELMTELRALVERHEANLKTMAPRRVA